MLFSEIDAHSVIEFVTKVDATNCDRVMVHCKAGISRSAAIAKWIALHYYLPFEHNYSQYNRHVFDLLCKLAGTQKLS